MYNEHFGFREAPFTTTPNSRFFYSNDHYREALANLRYGIEWRKGLIVMTGEVGTGKTTLLGKTMRSLEGTVHPIFISYDHLTSAELLRLIVRELRLPYDRDDRLSALEHLRTYLIKQYKKSHIVALLIDEAQNLSDEMFEDIRFLSNFETEDDKLLQIVLTGQPELDSRLDHVHLRHIRQRIVVHCRLAPLEADEVSRYIDARLQEAGYKGKALFDADAVARIAIYSAGIPRLINIVCDNALLLAYAQSKNKIGIHMVEEVVVDLGLNRPRRELPMRAGGEHGGEAIKLPPSRPVSKSIPPATRSKRRETISFALIPAGVSLALVAIGSSGGAFNAWPIRDYFHHTATSEEQPLARRQPANQIVEPSSPDSGRRAAARQADDSKRRMAQADSLASNTAETAPPDRPVTPQRKSAASARFEVTGPNSFVRGSPHAASKIIATLPRGTEITVLGKKGNYFQVQANVDGRRVRGYVHREDAFFERVKNNGRHRPQ